jgi:hypothetical protein
MGRHSPEVTEFSKALAELHADRIERYGLR